MTTENKQLFPIDQLATQFTELLAKGGNMGMVYDYNKEDYDLLYALGHGMYTQGRYADAVKVFGYLNVMDPFERRFVNAYAASLKMINQPAEAMKFYGMVSAMDMRDPLPTFHICDCMIAIGMVDEARSGLSIVVSQCQTPEQEPLKLRAQALLLLLEQASPVGTPDSKTMTSTGA